VRQNSENKKLRISDDIREPIRFIKNNLKKDLVGAEIGVYLGNHAKQMLDYLPLKKLYLIDDWVNNVVKLENETVTRRSTSFAYSRALTTLKPYSDSIEIIKEESIIAVQQIEDKSLDFVYIDGCHNCDSVFSDIYIWEKKVKRNGVLCGHDYKWHGVRNGIDIYLKFFPRKLNSYNSVRGDWWWVVQ